MGSACVVYTARVTYAGADRLDVTRKSAGPEGLPFAPSWAILTPMLDARRRWKAARPPFVDRVIEETELWGTYVVAYRDEMRASYKASHRHASARRGGRGGHGSGETSSARATRGAGASATSERSEGDGPRTVSHADPAADAHVVAARAVLAWLARRGAVELHAAARVLGPVRPLRPRGVVVTCERCAAGESWDTHHCHACGLVDGHEPDCVRKHGLGYDGLHAWHSEACTLLRERDEARADLAHCRDELADTARHCARIMSERDALRAALERIAAMARPDGDLAAHVAWHALRAALARGDGRAT